MKVACKYCGIVSKPHDCPRKPKKFKKGTEADRFRWSNVWSEKREEIRSRDNNLCQVCIRNLHGTTYIYNYNDLSVHHIVSLKEDFEKRLDNDNLITVCQRHHEAAESGLISKVVLLKIAKENESKGI